ncbi:MAG: cold-shock protein [Pikeienuella sp.]
MTEAAISETLVGRIKWYDNVKGYGFVATEDGQGDVLLHANCLRRSDVTDAPDGAKVVLEVVQGERGRQAVKVVELVIDAVLTPPDPANTMRPTQILEITDEDGEWLPARVKWFDRAKGFGFLNVFGDDADVFVHMETLRTSGLPDLLAGEAVATRVIKGPRGKMAAEVQAWDRVQTGSLSAMSAE